MFLTLKGSPMSKTIEKMPQEPSKPRRTTRPVIAAVNRCDGILRELNGYDVRIALAMLNDIYACDPCPSEEVAGEGHQ